MQLGLYGCQIVSAFESFRGSPCRMPEEFLAPAERLASVLQNTPFKACADLISHHISIHPSLRDIEFGAGIGRHPLARAILGYSDDLERQETLDAAFRSHVFMPDSPEPSVPHLMTLFAAAGPEGTVLPGKRRGLRVIARTLSTEADARHPALRTSDVLDSIDQIYPRKTGIASCECVCK